MAMPKETKYEPSQLTTRHWIIMNGPIKEQVTGEGVIGLFPIMRPGAYFEYESCCKINKGKEGSMEGSFQMLSSTSKQIFNATVPLFTLALCCPIKHAKELQTNATTTAL